MEGGREKERGREGERAYISGGRGGERGEGRRGRGGKEAGVFLGYV